MSSLPSAAGVSRAALQARSRTLVKTVVYRILMVIVTVTVAFFVTGNVTDAATIGLGTNVVKTGTYYGYERVWAHVDWGLAEGVS
ncbi:DUF2061 domain-containing protein [Halovivax asiaticus]|nr:DUF2061 domain-containing protein [Halovivax asiaticus]